MSRSESMNLTLEQLLAWLPESRGVGDMAVQVTRVHTDTRSLRSGDLFVALKGEQFDAANFLDEARAAGAVAAVCGFDAAERLQTSGLPAVLVPDTRAALGEMARRWRQRFDGPLIAVTGSNGKTTVTQMIASILHAWQGEAALATQGNLNNEIGLPLTLLRLRPHHRVAVVELGMNHPGEIARLAAIAQPDVALVNNAQREHQEFMVSVEAVARENGSVFQALSSEGTAVFPRGDEYEAIWQQQAAGRRQLRFGGHAAGATAHVQDAVWQGESWRVQVGLPDGQLSFDLHAPGRHNLHNAQAALACAHAVGVPVGAMRQGLTDFRPLSGRSRSITLRRRGRAITLIDDSYNANPDSVRALIDVLAELPGPRLLVLGDMGEVGQRGPAFHAEVGSYARQRGIEHLLAHGQLAIHAAMAFGGSHFDDMERLVAAVKTHLAQCVSVAVKGSRSMRMERVVEALTQPADPTTEGVHAA